MPNSLLNLLKTTTEPPFTNEVGVGEWFLTFFKDFVGTPAILIGLFAMLGAILLRKKPMK